MMKTEHKLNEEEITRNMEIFAKIINIEKSLELLFTEFVNEYSTKDPNQKKLQNFSNNYQANKKQIFDFIQEQSELHKYLKIPAKKIEEIINSFK